MKPNSAPLRQVAVAAAMVMLLAASVAHAQSWAPIGGAGKARLVELPASATFPVPASIAARGGALRVTLVGGGEGGHASKARCDAQAIQGGKGGDGGEVLELELALKPGQCTAGINVVTGKAGRGGASGAAGEPGGATIVSCSGVQMATALGGGRRVDAFTAPRSAKGGAGAVVMNTLEQATESPAPGAAIDSRAVSINPGGDGQQGHGGYGSGGGGGGATVMMAGTVVRPDGTVLRRSAARNAPLGKGSYGAGSGAGPAEYSDEAVLYPAEHAAQYGAGGGGGAAVCGADAGAARQAGNGVGGLVRIQWVD